MRMPPSGDLKEILRLTQENNQMLHKMRRGALLKTLMQLVIYAVLLIVPIYFYLTYAAPVVNQMLVTVQQIQGTGAQAQAQLGSFQDLIKSFTDRFKVGSTTN